MESIVCARNRDPTDFSRIMHGANNKQDIFESEEGMMRVKGYLAQALSKPECQHHTYVIMTNH